MITERNSMITHFELTIDELLAAFQLCALALPLIIIIKAASSNHWACRGHRLHTAHGP